MNLVLRIFCVAVAALLSGCINHTVYVSGRIIDISSPEKSFDVILKEEGSFKDAMLEDYRVAKYLSGGLKSYGYSYDQNARNLPDIYLVLTWGTDTEYVTVRKEKPYATAEACGADLYYKLESEYRLDNFEEMLPGLFSKDVDQFIDMHKADSLYTSKREKKRLSEKLDSVCRKIVLKNEYRYYDATESNTFTTLRISELLSDSIMAEKDISTPWPMTIRSKRNRIAMLAALARVLSSGEAIPDSIVVSETDPDYKALKLQVE